MPGIFMQVRSKLSNPSRRQANRSGFTIIEMLIVIGIMALLTALVLGTITRIGAGNRRMTCQSNLAQLYQSCRLYQQDEGGFPFYYDSARVTGASPPSLSSNIGLWALYAFPKSGNPNTADPAGPTGRYLRSTRVFHCPQDNLTGTPSLLNPLDATSFNDSYLSYQQVDPDGIRQYQSVRTVTGSSADWKRQLVTYSGSSRVYRAPADNTIVTWCPFHRKAVGGRDFDNVLFYDGSIQILPRQPDDGSLGWQRVQKGPI